MLLRFFLILFVKMVVGAFGVLSCSSDNDCSDGYFCDLKTCRKCLKCDLLFRKGDSCVTDFNDCQGCLPGYEEILTTDFFTFVKPCKLSKKKVKLKTCANDNSCPPSSYCDGDNCIKCFDCSVVNRLSPLGKCAKGLNECGACMIGFSEVAVTTETNYKPCEKNDFTMHTLYKKSYSVTPLYFLSALLVAAIAVIFVLKHRKDRSSIKITHENPVKPSAPPLYLLDMPQCVRKPEVSNMSPCFQKQETPVCVMQEETKPSVPCVREKKQLAKVFKQPDASYYFYTDEELQERTMNESSSEMNQSSRPSFWASATSALPEEMTCSAAIWIHRYSDLNANESSRILQPSDNSSQSMVLDITDGTQTPERSVPEMSNIQSNKQGET